MAPELVGCLDVPDRLVDYQPVQVVRQRLTTLEQPVRFHLPRLRFPSLRRLPGSDHERIAGAKRDREVVEVVVQVDHIDIACDRLRLETAIPQCSL